MLAERMKQWAQDDFAKGMQEGVRKGVLEGRLEGKLEGEQATLLRLLGRRFGPLPAARREQIAHADLEQVEIWFDRAIEATALDQVFDEAAH